MTWEGFWAPNLVQWLVGGALSAAVAFVIGRLIRRWLDQLSGEQQKTTETAGAAASATTLAIEAWKTRTDDLLAAVLRQEVIAINQERTGAEQARLAAEVDRIKRYLAEHEHDTHAAIRRITDQGDTS